ncbi:MAG TPA: nucleoside-diphosphate sugar epimerase/dehydratase [Candidatus Limnocylindrales bacterium]|nr:nucleoside-diphosphate sugar epimerase/dehydratase [Candidatus Limnocylindrales bacterium]
MRRHGAPRAVPPGGLLFLFDLGATGVGIVLSLMLRFETLDLGEAVLPYLPAALIPLVVTPPVRMAFGLYRREWRFASTRELWDILAASFVGSVLSLAVYGLAAYVNVPGANPFPRSFFLVEPLITLALVGGVRFLFRMRLEQGIARGSRERFVRTLIYGAGEAGASIARSSARDPRMEIHVVGFIDDDERKHGSRLLGHRVYGALEDLPAIVEKTDARQLLIAMPSRTGIPLRRAAAAGQSLGMDVKTIPPILDILTGEIQLARPRSISVEDLLRRESVELDIDAIAGYLNGASVLVTGGGGSIGGELVRQILRLGPRVLTVVDSQESGLWNVERDAAPVLATSGVRLNPVLADVRSRRGMAAVIGRARPDVAFHAAALKHVPYVEMHPSQGVLTNVIGTRNVLEACEAARVPRFVLISTDKAVEPSSVMGSTKRLAELLTIEVGHRSGLRFSAVRFGNVLGSSGSLVPLLERQLDDGLPLTITEPDATRYFMTLGEAVTLILEAGAGAKPGEIYVLDMGDPVRIGDLVHDLVRMKGISEDRVEYRLTGLRPGEKLHEKLFFTEEVAEPTDHPGIRRATGGRQSAAPVGDRLTELERAARDHDDTEVRRLLSTILAAEPAPVATRHDG